MTAPDLAQLRTVFRTTLIDQTRDRRSLLAAFVYTLVGPVLLFAMFSMMAKANDADRTVTLAVAGAAYAPNLVADLERRGVVVERRSAPRSPALNDLPTELGKADALLVIPSDFGSRYEAGTPARLMLFRDDRKRSSTSAARRVEKHLEAYGSFLVQSRLVGRGLTADSMMPIVVRDTNISQASGATMLMAGSLVAFFILAPFFTSMTTAIDVTAGERERQSLKPLLGQPVDAAALILGKWAVPALFAIAGTTVTALLGYLTLEIAPIEKLGSALSLDVPRLGVLLLVLLPLCLAVAALQSAIAMLAKTFKEAQTYIQLLSFAPLVLTFSSSFSGNSGNSGSILPIIGHDQIVQDILANTAVDPRQAILVSLLTMAVCALGLEISRRQFTDERLIAQL